MGLQIIQRNVFKAIIALSLFFAVRQVGYSQQLEIAHNHIFSPIWSNPASLTKELMRISLLHQHRNLAGFGWGTISQFVDLKSKPLGKRKAFGWGVNISNDFEHTERRLNVGFSFGAKVIQTDLFHVGLGINLGMINWGASYTDVPVYHQNDPKLVRLTNFSELDAGAGLNIGINTYVVRSSVDIWAKQLPGSFLSQDPILGLMLSPHVYMGGKFLYNIGPDVFLGPMVLYRNVFSSDSLVGGIRRGQLDAGLKIEMDRPRMWGGAAYRIGNAAVTMNYGLQIKGTDTTESREQIASFIDLVFSASYPLNNKSVFGPSAEIGIALAFGKVGSDEQDIDTIGRMRGAFWVNNGNMDTHKERYLKANAPGGLRAETLLEEERVYLNYEWDDILYLYAGGNMKLAGDSMIAFLGEDWVGVDGVLENMVNEVISEALHPVHTDVENPDSVEALKDLISLNLSARLKFDQIAADFGAEGIAYQGELGFNNPTMDTLTLPIIYDGRDTVVRIPKDKRITNLELSALKLHAMQRKLEYELDKYYSSQFAFVTDVNMIFENEGKKIVLVDYPEIIPNNPNQEPFQVTMVNLGFSRDPNWEPKITKRKDRGKSDAEKAVRKRDRDNFRDPVSGDDEEVQ